MATGHIMMAMTLDGFVARTDHTLDWLMKQPTEGEDHGFEDFQNSVDAIVMGTGSFRTVLGFDQWVYKKPVIVLSHSMTQAEVPDSLTGKVEVSRLEPAALMKSLKDRGFDRIYVDGGAVIRSFLSAGFISDMRLTIVPILIGEGIRIFGTLPADIDLTLQRVQEFRSGLVTLHYQLPVGHT